MTVEIYDLEGTYVGGVTPPTVIAPEELTNFAHEISVSGDNMVITDTRAYDGNENVGMAFLYRKNNGVWEFESELRADGLEKECEWYGVDVKVNERHIVITSPEFNTPFPPPYGTAWDVGAIFPYTVYDSNQQPHVNKFASFTPRELIFDPTAGSVDGVRHTTAYAYGDFLFSAHEEFYPNGVVDEVGGGLSVFKKDGGGSYQYVETLTGAFDEYSEFGLVSKFDGTFLIVGAPFDVPPSGGDGAAFLYKWNGASFDLIDNLQSPSGVYASHAMDINNGYVATVFKTTTTERVRIYSYGDYGFTFVEELPAATDVEYALDNDATIVFRDDIIVVGNPESRISGIPISGNGYYGTASVYSDFGSGWSHVDNIYDNDVHADSAYFGDMIDVNDKYMVISSPTDDSYVGSSETLVGSVRVYKRDNFNFSLMAKIAPPEGEYSNSQYFGYSVALHGDTILVSELFDHINSAGGIRTFHILEDDSIVHANHLQSSPATPNDGFGSEFAILDDGTLFAVYNGAEEFVISFDST